MSKYSETSAALFDSIHSEILSTRKAGTVLFWGENVKTECKFTERMLKQHKSILRPRVDRSRSSG